MVSAQSSAISSFLLARIAEDEARARAVDHGRWIHQDKVVTFEFWDTEHGDYDWQTMLSADTRANGEHIAEWDPIRVLAECAAKRHIIELYAPSDEPPATDAELHLRHAHPEWEYLTVETGRKTGEDDSPPDDTWEPNAGLDETLPDGTVIPGRNWERLEYTEETYYRRRRETPRVWTTPATLRHLASVYADHPDYQQAWRP